MSTETHSHSESENHQHLHDSNTEHNHRHLQTKSVLNRLSRAIGHLSAVRTMVEDERDCSEVLMQLAAVRSAINRVSEIILKDHLDNCIVDAVQTGDMAAIERLNQAIELLMK